MTDDINGLRLTRQDRSAAGPNHTADRESAEYGLDASILSEIVDAATCADPSEAMPRLMRLASGRVDVETLIDCYIPAVARHFGERWHDDGMSFAHVTMAVARLQGWLRDLTRSEDPFRYGDANGPEVLVVVPKGTQHTLGGLVALTQFRRHGAAAQLSMGEDAERIGARVRQQRFDLVALSASASDKLEILRSVVNNIRTGVAPAPWVVIGGSILNDVADVCDRVAADLATSDPREALALCDPRRSNRADRVSAAENTRPSAGRPVQVR